MSDSKWPKTEKGLASAITKANRERKDRFGKKEIYKSLSKSATSDLIIKKKLTWPKWLRGMSVKQDYFKEIKVLLNEDGVFVRFYPSVGGMFHCICPIGKIGDVFVTPTGARFEIVGISLDESFYWIVRIKPQN